MTDNNAPAAAPMTDDALAALVTAARAATPGPWRWNLHFGSKVLELIGHRSVYVMGFRRWGMHSAAPTFRSADTADGFHGIMKRADEYMVVDPARRHHADWHRLLVHPDAAYISAANPAAVLALAARCEAAEAEVDELRAERSQWRETAERDTLAAESREADWRRGYSAASALAAEERARWLAADARAERLAAALASIAGDGCRGWRTCAYHGFAPGDQCPSCRARAVLAAEPDAEVGR